jgi:hypothetical protein
MRQLQLLYALGCTIWTLYMIQLLVSLRPSHPEATLRGDVMCVLLLAVFPAVIGYAIVFKALPRIGRLITRS